ncbi:MAG: hypothetical protein ACREDR_27030, partial [Blastocatellia bacterium]
IRAVLTVKIAGFDPELVQLPQAEAQSLTDIANRFSEQDLVRCFAILTKTEQDIRVSPQPRFQLEIGLVKLAHAVRLFPVEQVLARLEEIQSRLGGGAAPASTRTQPGPLRADPPRPSPRQPANVHVDPNPYSHPTAGRTPERAASTPGHQAQTAPAPQAQRIPSRPPQPAKVTEKAPAVERANVPAHRSAASEPPPEPPPLADEPLDQPDPPPAYRESAGSAVEKIMTELNKRRRTLLVGALEHAELSVDGDFLKVSFPPSQASFKKQLDSKDKRAQIEEACQQALGRRVTLSITTGAEPAATGGGQPSGPSPSSTGSGSGDRPEDHPAVKGFVEKFHGEVIDVLKTER